MIIIEAKSTINVMRLNHPETILPPPPPSVEKLSSTKPVAGAREVGALWVNTLGPRPLV